MLFELRPQHQREQQRDNGNFEPLEGHRQEAKKEHDVDIEEGVAQRIGPQNAQGDDDWEKKRAGNGQQFYNHAQP